MLDPVVKTVEVACGPDEAFAVFVERIAKWWPLDAKAVSAASGKAALGVTIEPHVGGAVYETMFDGARADWGKILEFKPGQRLSMTWHPGNNADAPTQVDVDFADAGPGRTKVTLTHSVWEVWGDEAAERRGMYDGGWIHVLENCFAQACVPA